MLWPLVADAQQQVRIGILSFRNLAQTQQQWQPTADWLGAELPQYRFQVIPLYYDDLTRSISERKVDFVFTNPEHYVSMRSRYGLAASATLLSLAGNHPANQFGGVIFTRADRQDIHGLPDLTGKVIASPGEWSLGGYLAQRWTLHKAGMELNKDARVLFTGMPHDKVVDAVLRGQAQAGFVRTGVIEAMQREGRLKAGDVRVLNAQPQHMFPLLLSTDLYPEWSFAVARDVPEPLAKAVTLALLRIPPESAAARAGNYYGFSPPGDYSAIEAIMARLRMHPERHAFGLSDVYDKYAVWVLGLLGTLLATAIALVVWFARGNRQLQHALDLSERLALRDALLKSLGEGVWGVDRDGRCTFINPAALRMLGYAREEVLGQDAHALFHHTCQDGSAHPASGCPVSLTLADGEARQSEEWFTRKDGSGFAVRMHTTAIRQDDEIVGAVVAFEDITEHQQLRELSRRLDELVAANPAVIYACTPAGRATYVSHNILGLFGYTSQAALEDPDWWHACVHPEDGARVQEGLARWLASGAEGVYQHLYRFRHAQGHYRWVEDQLRAIHDAEGRVVELIGAFSDVSGRVEIAERLRKIAQHLPGVIYQYQLHPDGRSCFPYASDGIQDIYGVTAAEVQHDAAPVFAVLHPDDIQRVSEAIGVSARKLSVWHEVYRVQHPAKGMLWVEGHATPELQADGSVLWHGYITDISVHKYAEQSVLESRNLLQLVIDSVPVRIFWKDLQSRYLGCNALFARDAGLDSAQQIVGKLDDALVWHDQAGLYLADDRQVIKSGIGRFAYQEPQTTPDGRTVWLSTSKVPLRDAHGEIVGVLGTYVDITEQKQAEDELRVAAVAFESQEGMLIADADGIILRVNRAFTETTGYSAREAIGKTPAMLQSGRHGEGFYREMWAALKREGQWQGEIWNRRKNGEIYPEWLTISAVRDEHGRVTHYVAAFVDITDRLAREDEIRKLAFYDSLTQLPNRRLLLDRLRLALVNCSRSQRHGALLFIDLDNFKTLNDSLGHDIGDLLLIEAAHRLQASVREGDTVSRLGGDEFVVMLEDLSPRLQEAAAQAEQVAEKARNALNQPYLLAGHECHSTSSIGISLIRKHEDTVEDLLKQADLAMYQAKAAGRNALRFFDPAMQAEVSRRLALETQLRRAVQRGEFVLHYQPQVSAEGAIVGVEALLRWQHPERGLVSPAEFIALAEETGLILPLGARVLNTACDQLRAWQVNATTAHLTLAVNVSVRQFRQEDFVAQVQAVLKRSGANPGCLKLEITESMLLEDAEGAILKMDQLRALGVHFSLDDFGTGYSSLSYLKRLPVDQIKIDQSFVRDIQSDPDDAAIAETIIGLGRTLKLAVIAEGVENAAQRDFLAQHGCRLFQGWLFGRPQPIEELQTLLAS